jgi:hypothetical protein
LPIVKSIYKENPYMYRSSCLDFFGINAKVKYTTNRLRF